MLTHERCNRSACSSAATDIWLLHKSHLEAASNPPSEREEPRSTKLDSLQLVSWVSPRLDNKGSAFTHAQFLCISFFSVRLQNHGPWFNSAADGVKHKHRLRFWLRLLSGHLTRVNIFCQAALFPHGWDKISVTCLSLLESLSIYDTESHSEFVSFWVLMSFGVKSAEMQKRSIQSKTAGLRNGFFPSAVRLLNSSWN